MKGLQAYQCGELPEGEIDFEVATDWLRDTHEVVARLLGRDAAVIPLFRMSPDAKGFRRPPADWPTVLAERADERAQQLQELAARLRRQAAGDDQRLTSPAAVGGERGAGGEARRPGPAPDHHQQEPPRLSLRQVHP